MIVRPSCGEENPERARFCLACGAELAEPSAGAEERKTVSVLFVDLVGFTDRLDPADLRTSARRSVRITRASPVVAQAA